MKKRTILAVVLVVFSALFCQANDGRQTPRPAFSFKYGDRAVTGSASMQVDERLKVTVESVEYPQFNATEWVLWFENPSAEKSAVLSEIHDGDFLVSLPPAPNKFRGDISVPGERAVVTMNGCGGGYSTNDEESSREFRAVTRYFHPTILGTNYVLKIDNGCARSSDRQAPFFEVTQDGQGAVIAIGWTGGWRAQFANCVDGIRVVAGLARARFYLEPGEKLRTSRILVMNYSKDEDSGNKFRRLIRRHFSHVASRPGTREGLFAYELWGGLTSDEMIHRVKTLKAKGLSYEDLWIDAGWYGNSKKCDDAYTGDWSEWTGDWIPNARIHPDGLEKVRDVAKDAGMGLMLWFEPEHVVKACNFAKEHPDLLLGLDERPWYGALLYYGNERARTYVRDLIAGFAERLNFSCYRQDFNMEPGRAMKQHDAPDREGITEIRHITGMYRLWDELLARRPQMLIDNCSSGGRRIDIETLRRAVAFFRSDYQCGFNANADVLQVHNAGISRLLPYNGCTTKLSDAYTLRSAYSSSHGVAYWNAIFQKEEKVDWAAAKKCCDEYRRIRKYFPCDFYNHGSKRLDPTAWAIWQYNDPEKGEGVVLAFRRAESPSSRVSIPLKGLPKGATVEVENLDTGAKSTVAGELEIYLPERRSSTVLLYRMRTVSPERMKAIYEEVKTPHKVGMALEPEEGEMLDNPTVFRHGKSWYMMFIRFDGKGYETHLAKSDDLRKWTRLGRIFSRGAKGQWDASQADGWPALVNTSWDGVSERDGLNALKPYGGKYWMMYLGGAKDGYETDPLSTGVAWTDDPSAVREWTRYEGNPVLQPSDSSARAFERATIYKHFTVDDPSRSCGGRFVNFYNAADKLSHRETIGMAVSDDMLHWRRVGDSPVIDNGDPKKHVISGDPMIRRIGDLWVMFYFGYQWRPGGAFDTFACSYDLQHWTKWDGEPLVKPSEEYDCIHAHKPWVLKHDGVVYHWYCAVGRRNGREVRGIALATSR